MRRVWVDLEDGYNIVVIPKGYECQPEQRLNFQAAVDIIVKYRDELERYRKEQARLHEIIDHERDVVGVCAEEKALLREDRDGLRLSLTTMLRRLEFMADLIEQDRAFVGRQL